MTSPVRRALPAFPAVLSALLPLLFVPGVLAGRVLFQRDLHLMFLAGRRMLDRAFSSGELPLWSPEMGFGRPLLANPGSTVSCPVPALLQLVFPPERVLTLSVCVYLCLAGLGAYLLARRIGLGKGPALLAGIAFSGSGPVLSGANLFLTLGSLCFLPWTLWAFESTLDAARSGSTRAWLRGCLWTGTFGALVFLGGEPAVVLITGAMWLLRLLAGPGAARRLSWASLPVAVAIALGLSAWMFLPAIQTVQESPRAGGIGEGAPLGWSLPPVRLLETALPGILGRTDTMSLSDYRGRDLYGGELPYVLGLYLGWTVLLLAGAGLILPSPERRRGWAAFLPAGIGALLLALGPATPVFILFRRIPGVGEMLRSPERFVVGVSLPVALLAGIGASRLLRPTVPPWGAAILVALVFADLWTGNRTLNPTAEVSLLRTTPLVPAPREGGLYCPELPSRIVIEAPDPGIEHLVRWAIARDDMPVAAGRGARLALDRDPDLMGSRRAWLLRKLYRTLPPDLQVRLLRLCGVVEERVFDPDYHARPVAESIPRASVVPRAQRLDDPEAIWRLLLEDPAFDPKEEIVVSDVEPPAGGRGGEARIVTDRAGRVAVRTSGGGGFLLLLDSYYPGWVARLGGERVPILRANYLFRAVAVPPGDQEVVFAYRPLAFATGLAITILTLLAAGLIAWIRV